MQEVTPAPQRSHSAPNSRCCCRSAHPVHIRVHIRYYPYPPLHPICPNQSSAHSFHTVMPSASSMPATQECHLRTAAAFHLREAITTMWLAKRKTSLVLLRERHISSKKLEKDFCLTVVSIWCKSIIYLQKVQEQHLSGERPNNFRFHWKFHWKPHQVM